MKKNYLFFIAVIMLISAAFKMADDILTKLGIENKYAHSGIVNNVIGVDAFKLPYSKFLPSVISGDKTGAAMELCEYVKQYCESTAYTADYNKYRESKKPSLSDEEPSQLDAESIEELKEASKTWDELAKDKSLPKEMRDEYKEMADDAKKTVAESADPTPKKTEWEKNYPEDPTPLIHKRLEEYLALVVTVDFNAQLTEPDEYKIRKFVNPAYERQSLQWKAIYRAGKEVNNVVTGFAKQWLKDGIKSGQPGSNFQQTSQPEEKAGINNNQDSKTEQQNNGVKIPSFKSIKNKVLNK